MNDETTATLITTFTLMRKQALDDIRFYQDLHDKTSAEFSHGVLEGLGMALTLVNLVKQETGQGQHDTK